MQDLLFIEDVAETRRARVWRARQRGADTTVIVKSVARTDDIGTTRCRNQYQLTRTVEFRGITRALDLIEEPDEIHLVMEDAGSVSLLGFIDTYRPDIESLLFIAEQIVFAVDELHSARILHRDLSLQNIVVQPDDLTVKIVDLGLAVRFEHLDGSSAVDSLQGTLAYIAPEQTGRLRKPIDHRSDLYSLGAVLYHLFSGSPPFVGADALEIVHAHVTRIAPSVRTLVPSLPEAVDKLILSLLEKEPDSRYQSAFGVLYDIQGIRRWLVDQTSHSTYTLKHKQTTTTFKHPKSVIGREHEISYLNGVLRVARTTHQQLVLISGVAGSGKSVIVQGFLEGNLGNDIVTASGKFEQYASGQPFSALVHVLDSLVRRFLRSSSEETDRWRTLLLTVLREDLSLLATIIPSLPLLVHDITKHEDTGAKQTRIRLISALARFIEVVARELSSLVIVLEDLHWADDTTFDVLNQVLTSHIAVPLVIIGTCRSETHFGSEHPLNIWPELPELRDRVSIMNVLPLSSGAIVKIIEESLSLTPEQCAPLAASLMQRTNGHPLFVSQYLAYLSDTGILHFNRQLQRWTWSEQRLRDVPIQFGVNDVIQARYLQLPEKTQSLLAIAALIGVEFSIPLLALVTEVSPDEVIADLRPAERAGLLNFVEHLHSPTGTFVHDRVQEIAVQSHTATDLAAIHARIVLAALSSDNQTNEVLSAFELADHVVRSSGQTSLADYQDQLLQVLLSAASKARQAGALKEAMEYSMEVRNLLGFSGWTTHHTVMATATLVAAESAGALGLYEAAHTLFDEHLSNVADTLEQANALSLKAEVLTREGRFGELMDVGCRGLELLGIHVNRSAGPVRLGWQILRTLQALNASLVKRRYTEDFNMDTTLRLADMLLFQLTAAGYNFGPEIMGHITLTRGMLAATHGHGPSTIDVYAHAGLVFMGAGLPNKALELGELALSLVDRSTSYEARARAHFIHLAHIHFWMKDFSSILPRFQRGIEFATRSGSQFLVFWGEGVAAELSAFAGIPLHLQHMRIQQGLDNLHTVYQRTDNLPWTSTYFLAAVSRVNYAYNPQLVPQKELSGLLENADGLMQDMIAAKDATAICSWSISEMKLALLREDISMGERAMLRFAEYKHGSVTQWTQCEVELYTALLIGVAVRHGPLRPEFVKRLRLAVHRLNTFAKRNSGTFGARASLARGIWNVHQQQYHQAFINFQQASQQAHEAKNLFLEATALEWSALAAESTIASNLATTIRQKAARLYRQFGAPVLAEKLESRKSQIRNEGALERVSLSQTIQTSTATTISLHRYAFDIDSIIKASSAIAGEIVHRNLVHRLLSIVLENAGADEGALIIETDAGLIIEAILSVVDGSFSLVSKPVEKSAAVCESALNLVVRTNDPLVVDEAFRDADYAGDPYIQERKVRSMMVIPIQHKGQRIGLLHVVNTHISQAFTPERLEVVKLLTTQIAVSLENARLYDEQRATLEAAARFVPREFLDALGMRSIREVSLSAGVRTTITVLFADIRRFTSISEQLSTDATFDLLNRYLKLVVPIIRKHQGFIDKYVGDAVMALFPGKPSDAVRAAQEIHAALQDFNAQQQASRNHRVTVGIGIHTGEVMLGTVGTADRLDTTVIGDTVNIAARLEELTKTYNTAILLSGETASLLDDNHAVLKQQGTEVIRGRMATVDLYSIET